MNGTTFKEHHLRVDSEKPLENNQRNSIFIGNLPFDIQEEDIWKCFEECGNILSVRVVRDNATGVGKGLGFVNFDHPDAVELALQLEATIGKRDVRVKRIASLDKKKTPEDSNMNLGFFPLRYILTERMAELYPYNLFVLVNFSIKLFNLDGRSKQRFKSCFLHWTLVATTTWTSLSAMALLIQNDFSGFVQNSMNFLIISHMWVKVLNIYNQRNKIVRLLESIRNVFWTIPENDPKCRSYHGHLKNIVLAYQAGIVLFGIIGFTTRIYRVVISKIWFFRGLHLEKLRSPYFEIINVFMYLSDSGGLLLIIVSDSLFLQASGCVVIQMIMLKEKFRNILRGDRSCVHQNLSELVEYHNFLLQFVYNIQEILVFPFLKQYLDSMTLIGMYLYHIEENLDMQFVFGLVMLSLQTFLFSFFGQELRNKSEDVALAVYDSNWQESMNLRFCTGVLIVLRRAQKPLIFSAGYIIELSFDSYLKIMKAASSLLALLTAVKVKNS